MDAQYKVLKQISIRINEYIHGDIILHWKESIDFMAQPTHVYSEEVFSEDVNSFNNLLGYYVLSNRAGSYGKVCLVSNNLEKYFWKIFVDIKKFVPRLDKNSPAMNTLARWIVAKIYWHERFHYHMDAIRQRVDTTQYNFSDNLMCEQEEALAVAYSYKHLHELKDNNDYPDVWDWFLKMVFRYTSPGFKDWFIYLDDEVFRLTLLELTGLTKRADLSILDALASKMVQSLSSVDSQYKECVNDDIGNQSGEMGRFIKITDLFTAKNELYLMWLTTFKWQQPEILSFLLSLPLNGFSIHIGIADGDIDKYWDKWIDEHTDSPDKRVIVDMPQGVSRENLYFLLDGEQRFVVLFLLFFIRGIKDGSLNKLFISDSCSKLTLISNEENAFLKALLSYLQHAGNEPTPATSVQKNLLDASLVIQKWMDLNQSLDDCYVFLIDYHSRESERLPFKYTDKHVRAHKLINCSIY